MRTFAQKEKPSQQTKSANSTTYGRTFFGQNHAVRSIPHLQRAIGNHAVQRLFHSTTEELEADSSTPASTGSVHDFSGIPLHAKARAEIQPKLTVGTPGDMYEREADRVAEKVMSMPEPKLQRACACGGGCPRYRKEQDNQRQLQTMGVQASVKGETVAPFIVHEDIRSPGQPLSPATRAFFEPRFGRDFSQVRLHTSSVAARVAADLRARAFTVGNRIVFGGGQYAPSSTEGRRLLAHELTHVIQQTERGFVGNLPPRVRSGVRHASAGHNGPSALASHPRITPLSPLVASRLLLQRTDDGLRTEKKCSPAIALPISETFPEFGRGTVYSPPFHAAEGRTIKVSVSAEYKPNAGQTLPSFDEYFGVSVRQCCTFSDEVIRDQEIEVIGKGRPNTISFTFSLPDECIFSTEDGDEFVYYLRIRNSANHWPPEIPVEISYTVG